MRNNCLIWIRYFFIRKNSNYHRSFELGWEDFIPLYPVPPAPLPWFDCPIAEVWNFFKYLLVAVLMTDEDIPVDILAKLLPAPEPGTYIVDDFCIPFEILLLGVYVLSCFFLLALPGIIDSRETIVPEEGLLLFYL